MANFTAEACRQSAKSLNPRRSGCVLGSNCRVFRLVDRDVPIAIFPTRNRAGTARSTFALAHGRTTLRVTGESNGFQRIGLSLLSSTAVDSFSLRSSITIARRPAGPSLRAEPQPCRCSRAQQVPRRSPCRSSARVWHRTAREQVRPRRGRFPRGRRRPR